MSGKSISTRHLAWLLLCLIFLCGLYQTISLRWVCDDALISFRYAENLVDGHGLVFNAGEKVEGYTNFLWTVIIAAGIKMGLDPVFSSQVLGITSFLTVALVFLHLTFRVALHPGSNLSIVIPLTALALLLHHDFQVYATPGLETAFTTALVSFGFCLLILGESTRSTLWAGLVLTLAVLARPDAMIFYVASVPFIVLRDRGRQWHVSLCYYLIPLVLIYLPYWVWRFSYYGYAFPNTYYAKSISSPYYSQGILYLWLFLKTTYVLLLLPVGLMAVTPRIFHQLTRGRLMEERDSRAFILGTLFALPYALFVVRIGGDFMFARLLIPIVPICFHLLETSLRVLVRPHTLRVAIGLLLLIGVVFRWDQYSSGIYKRQGISDEHAFYPPEVVEQVKIDAEGLKQ